MEKAITLIAGLLSLAIGIVMIHNRVSKIRTGFVARATVIQIESTRGERNSLLQ